MLLISIFYPHMTIELINLSCRRWFTVITVSESVTFTKGWFSLNDIQESYWKGFHYGGFCVCYCIIWILLYSWWDTYPVRREILLPRFVLILESVDFDAELLCCNCSWGSEQCSWGTVVLEQEDLAYRAFPRAWTGHLPPWRQLAASWGQDFGSWLVLSLRWLNDCAS